MKKTIEIEHSEGSIVFLRTDPDQFKRIVVGYQVRKDQIMYILRCETEETPHYPCEISATQDVIYRTSN